MITLQQTHFTEIQLHGIEAFPEECCGALLGYLNAETGAKTTVECIRIENTSSENRHRRFAITALDYMALEKLAKEKKLTLLGFYHTHPNHPAKPSETDLAYAWPVFSYLILSVLDGKPDQLNSFLLNLDEGKFEVEELSISD